MSNPTTTATSPNSTTKSRRSVLTTSKRAEAVALWAAGEVTLEDLEKRFKVDKRTLTRLFKRENVKKGQASEQTKQKVIQAVEETIVTDATVYAQRVKDTKEEHYKMAATLSKLVYSKIIRCEKEQKPLGVIAADLKSAQIATLTLKMLREERYATLGINANDLSEDRPLPDLTVQELTVEDIQRMSQENMVQDDENFGIDGGDLGDESLINDQDKDEKVIEGE